MKAIQMQQFGGPEVMKLQEIPDPQPAAQQVVVKISAIGVNPVDTYIRAGIYGERPFPFTPGSDAAGVVESVGPDVSRFKPGDRVYTAGAGGTYAEKVLCNENQVHRLPENVSFEQGAALGVPYATAYRALFIRGEARPAESVLVHGATGGVGTAAVQLARGAGLFIIGTGGSEAGRELILKEGAHHALDHHADGYLQEVMNLTGGRGVNLILEMLANVNLGKDLTILAKRGRVVVIGSRGPVQVDPRLTMGRDSSILGMSLMNAPAEELQSIHAALYAGLENRTLRPIIDQTFPLAEAPRAHETVMEGGSAGKILLVP